MCMTAAAAAAAARFGPPFPSRLLSRLATTARFVSVRGVVVERSTKKSLLIQRVRRADPQPLSQD
jgi:hypothetical protein